MVQHEVTRTLVKSQPEVWAQCSEAASLERHLNGSFGEIRITRLEPEHAVAWEGEQVSGTVKIEPSAWGTRVTMAVEVEGESQAVAAQAPVEEPVAQAPVEEPVTQAAVEEPLVEASDEAEVRSAIEERQDSAPPPPDPDPPRGLWARLREWFAPSAQPVVAEEPAPVSPPEPEERVPQAVAEPEPIAEPEPSPPSAPEPGPPDSPSEAAEALNAALESLGQAHHRPYSRA